MQLQKSIDMQVVAKLSCIQKGDVNGDGVIDSTDISKEERIILALEPITEGADANSDGRVDIADVTKIERYIAGLDVPPVCKITTPTSTNTPTPTPKLSCIQKGDVNGDGAINKADVTKIERIILGLDPATEGADVNGDGKIDMTDSVKIERYILGLDTPPGCNVTSPAVSVNYDLNNDRVVNCKDVEIFNNIWAKKITSPLNVDFNNDDKVDQLDYNMHLRNFTSGSSTACPQ